MFGIEYDSKSDSELQSTSESVLTRDRNGMLIVHSIDPNDDMFQMELNDGFQACHVNLAVCQDCLKSAKSIQIGLVLTLKNGIHEPEIFTK